MKLRSLLLITNALLISALLLCAGVFVYVMAHLQHNSLLLEESIESIEAAEKVEADLLQHGRLSLLSIIDNQNDYELKLKLLAKSILGKLENYKRFANDKEELALLLQTNSQSCPGPDDTCRSVHSAGRRGQFPTGWQRS